MGNQKNRIGVILIAILIGFYIKFNYLDRPTLVTVVGEGKVKVTPTIVKFTLTISNISQTSTQALADNNRLVRDVLAVLRSSGVEDKDISLSYPRLIPPQTTLGQTSWQAVNSGNVTLKDISKFDNLVVQLYANGIQGISNILFTTENSRDLEKQAVDLAIKEATLRAKEIARAMKKRMGRMVSVATVEVGEAGALTGEAKTASFEGAITSSPSQIEITRQASIVFELR